MSEALLTVRNLTKHFPVRRGVFAQVTGHVRAVDDISFEIPRGKTLALVGESGSGKTTAGRAILRLIEPTSGSVRFDGVELTTLERPALRSLRKRMQLIFQDPYGSLNPRMTVYNVLWEAMAIHGIARERRRDRIYELIAQVGLSETAADRYPHEFSGGQRQRIGIARALSVEPDIIVADEPVSALDVSVQAQILNLLTQLQEELGLTYLFIGHDLSVVRHIADEVAVMYLGKIVEAGPVKSLFSGPIHPYTRALLSAAPTPDPSARKQRILVTGEVPSPMNPPPGCRFHPRCPDAEGRCSAGIPELTGSGHRAACFVHGPPAEETD